MDKRGQTINGSGLVHPCKLLAGVSENLGFAGNGPAAAGRECWARSEALVPPEAALGLAE